jgi:hypothetical protein
VNCATCKTEIRPDSVFCALCGAVFGSASNNGVPLRWQNENLNMERSSMDSLGTYSCEPADCESSPNEPADSGATDPARRPVLPLVRFAKPKNGRTNMKSLLKLTYVVFFRPFARPTAIKNGSGSVSEGGMSGSFTPPTPPKVALLARRGIQH